MFLDILIFVKTLGSLFRRGNMPIRGKVTDFYKLLHIINWIICLFENKNQYKNNSLRIKQLKELKILDYVFFSNECQKHFSQHSPS